MFAEASDKLAPYAKGNEDLQKVYDCMGDDAGIARCLKDIGEDFAHIFEMSELIDDNWKISTGAEIVNGLLAVFRALF